MLKTIPLLELVYIAGFLDGDGSIIAQLVSRKDYKWGFQIRLSIQFTQSSKRRVYLEKIQETLGVGYCRNRITKNHTSKGVPLGGQMSPYQGVESYCDTNPPHLEVKMSDYVISETRNVYSLLKLIQPYLKIKQKQANLVLTLIEQLPLAKDSPDKFLELAKMVDQIAVLNDSKHRKIASLAVLKHLTAIKLKESKV